MATADELKLAELAVLKRDLTAQLEEVRAQMRALGKTVHLPVITVLNGEAVHVSKPQFMDGVPQAKFARATTR